MIMKVVFILLLVAVAIIAIIIYTSHLAETHKKIIDNLQSVRNEIFTSTKSMRSLITEKEEKVESVITQYAQNNESMIAGTEERLTKELISSTKAIQDTIQNSHSDISINFMNNLNNISDEMIGLRQNLTELKDNILRARGEEHQFFEQELQAISKEQASASQCIQELGKSINDHFTSIKPIEELLEKSNALYNKLISLDEDILNQEKSLNGMVAKHTKILEYTHELQKTSEEIFELMKLLLMDSVIKNTTPDK